MLEKPDVPDAVLVTLLRQGWGLDATQVRFIRASPQWWRELTPLPSYDSYVSGSVADEQPHRPHVGGTHGLATASLVLGICGAVPLVNLLAMVFGVIALLQLRDVNQKGRGLAIGGICAAGCWILLYVVIAITLAIRTE